MKGRYTDLLTGIGPVRFFVIAAATFGLFFLLATPPFQGADEPAHFFRAYDISSGHLKVGREGEEPGNDLPVVLQEVVTKTTSQSLPFHPNIKYGVGNTRAALSIRTNSTKGFYDLSSTAAYSPISYIPSVVGILVGRVLHLPAIVWLYAGRLGDLIGWIVLVALSIHLLPRKKWALVFIGLLPMSLFQAATLNSDVMAIGTTFLFCSYVFLLASKPRRINRKEAFVLLGLALLMSLSKEVMFMFLPLVLLLKPEQFSTRMKEWSLKGGIVIGPIMIAVLWYVVATHHLSLAGSYANGAEPTQQTKRLLRHPYDFLNAMWNTYFYTWGDTITNSFIGTFGWMDTPLSELIVVLGYIALIAVATINIDPKEKEWFSKRDKLLLGAVLALYVVAVSAALYTTYTPVGFKIVVGLQGRYFIPGSVIGIGLLSSRWLTATKRGYYRIATYAPLLLLIAATITLYVRYYINNV